MAQSNRNVRRIPEALLPAYELLLARYQQNLAAAKEDAKRIAAEKALEETIQEMSIAQQ